MKNLYSFYLIDKEIKKFSGNKVTTKENTNTDHNQKSVCYYKLPYIGSYPSSTKKNIYELCKTFCKNTNAKIVFSPFKLQDIFFFKILFASCSEVLCCVRIYLRRMSILLHWGNQISFTNKDQGTFAN